MTKPLGVILAGGLATRMGGGDKCLLPLGTGTLLSQVRARLTPQVGAIALNANGDPDRLAHANLPILADSIQGFAGPLAGILAGLDWAATQDATHIVSAAADTPFFPIDLVERLCAQAEKSHAPIVLAATQDPVRGPMRQPTFGLWPVALRHDLRAALNDGLRKVVLWTDKHNASQTVFDPDPFDPFFNVNTPEDLVKAQQYLDAAS